DTNALADQRLPALDVDRREIGEALDRLPDIVALGLKRVDQRLVTVAERLNLKAPFVGVVDAWAEVWVGEHRLPEVVEIAAVSRIFGQEGALDRLGSLCTVAVGRIDHSTKLRLVPGRGVEPHRRVDRQ